MRTAVCGDWCTGRRLGRAPPGYGSWAQILGLDKQCCLVTSDTGPFTVQLPSPPPQFRALAPLPHPTSQLIRVSILHVMEPVCGVKWLIYRL